MRVLARNVEPGRKPDEFSFTDEDFQTIANLANAKYGLHLQESKKALVYSRLARRLRALDLDSFRNYCSLLDTSAGETEHSHFLSALTTNVTHFFRESHHFDQLRSAILPKLVESARSGGSIRIWSAACSAGQEAYCLAATILDNCPDAAKLDIKVLATDVDPVVLETARNGQYPNEQMRALGNEYSRKMIDQNNPAEGTFTMHHKLREIITFRQLNLMDPWPMRKPFDIIMCRNAAIYFDKATQSRLWSRFEQALTSEGYLMIGHSERIAGAAASKFKSVGVTAYQKIQTA